MIGWHSTDLEKILFLGRRADFRFLQVNPALPDPGRLRELLRRLRNRCRPPNRLSLPHLDRRRDGLLGKPCSDDRDLYFLPHRGIDDVTPYDRRILVGCLLPDSWKVDD